MKEKTVKQRKIRALIELAGGVEIVAAIFGITHSAVFLWYSKGIPAGRAAKLAELSGGKFTAEEILNEMGAR